MFGIGLLSCKVCGHCGVFDRCPKCAEADYISSHIKFWEEINEAGLKPEEGEHGESDRGAGLDSGEGPANEISRAGFPRAEREVIEPKIRRLH